MLRTHFSAHHEAGGDGWLVLETDGSQSSTEQLFLRRLHRVQHERLAGLGELAGVPPLDLRQSTVRDSSHGVVHPQNHEIKLR